MTTKNPFRYFKTSPEVIQIAVMMYVRFALSLRNVEDLLHERGIDVCHESIRLWVDRFGTFFARTIRKRRAQADAPSSRNGRWHVDEVFVKIAGETHYLCARDRLMKARCSKPTSRRHGTKLLH